MSGRIVMEQGTTRYVELSLEHQDAQWHPDSDKWIAPIEQTLVVCEPESVTLFRLNTLKSPEQFTLTHEELQVLIQAYPHYYQSIQGRQSVYEIGNLDDHPF
ncbi:hypothetical protein [Dictyobacter kobayashii]|uniref:Uncharacterized protein n=1 Tax=Dictyobacter kobayashii TaxID=2014872 RepID=A0A402AHR4_9CHLR|nr:hypothetical protein [Dictyobacter kobayashii]GCE18639.1 hypothetical protein KDK_24390 [Dictyobacter kobayashii]